MSLAPLPIDDVLPQVIAALARQPNVVLKAPTGSGKTTRVAPAILDAGLAGTGSIVMLEPRRVAARAAARRIAFERGGAVGGEIGYAVRFDQKIGRETRLRIVTDGILLRNLQDDPFLEPFSAVVFDEFHERGINVDLAFAMVRRIQQTVRHDLKIVVMSATLAVEPVAAFLGGCPVVVAEGSLFPVELAYLGGKKCESGLVVPLGESMHSAGGRFNPLFGARGIETVVRAIREALDHTQGDLLVFLPGVGEIRRFEKELAELAARSNLALMPLYGDLPAEQQDAVLGPSTRRRVVLATNVAETSITIDGVTAVVDTGLARVLRFDEHVGLDKLVLGKISKASAAQRAGRAGRTQPGIALRLWTSEEQRALPDEDEPEIRRVDLAGPALQLHAWEESDVAAFPWFEPPRELSLAQAEKLLVRLGAIESGKITALGRTLSRLPVHPRVARLLVAGHQLGVSERAALAAALLSERSPFVSGMRARQRRQAAHQSESDLVDRVAILEEFSASDGRPSRSESIDNAGVAHFVLRVKDQLLELLEQTCGRAADLPAGVSADEALQRAVLAAFPDRVARRREMSGRRGVMVGGRGVRLADESAVTASELFVCVDVDAGTTEALVRVASAVDRDWLDPKLLETRDDVTFDPRSSRVVALRRTCWDDLVLDEAALGHIPEDKLAAALAAAAAEELNRVFPREGDVPDYLERVKSLRDWMPELDLPALDDAQLAGLLPELCWNCRSFDDVRRAAWLRGIKSLLTPAQLQAVEREAPEKLSVPSGNRVTIQYKAGKRPVLAVRIQELFGLTETPRIAGGRIPVLMHLLAPNMRPQQVTDDLQSFWNKTYQQVRKDLRARYPKHSWPEDPWNAQPQRRPGRKS
ncbi:MAG: ATP-dependent helicase HrpB [Planctomycetia bacterium]|nr:ATP-dependent helicase HrpB [Planctomycetia bacterium]